MSTSRALRGPEAQVKDSGKATVGHCRKHRLRTIHFRKIMAKTAKSKKMVVRSSVCVLAGWGRKRWMWRE